MNDPVVVEKIARWQKLNALVLDIVSSPITRQMEERIAELSKQVAQPPDRHSHGDRLSARSVPDGSAIWARTNTAGE